VITKEDTKIEFKQFNTLFCDIFGQNSFKTEKITYKNIDEFKFKKKKDKLSLQLNDGEEIKNVKLLANILLYMWHCNLDSKNIDVNDTSLSHLNNDIKIKIKEYVKNINSYNKPYGISIFDSIKYNYKIICIDDCIKRLLVLNFIPKDILMIINEYAREPLIVASNIFLPAVLFQYYGTRYIFNILSIISLNLKSLKIIFIEDTKYFDPLSYEKYIKILDDQTNEESKEITLCCEKKGEKITYKLGISYNYYKILSSYTIDNLIEKLKNIDKNTGKKKDVLVLTKKNTKNQIRKLLHINYENFYQDINVTDRMIRKLKINFKSVIIEEIAKKINIRNNDKNLIILQTYWKSTFHINIDIILTNYDNLNNIINDLEFSKREIEFIRHDMKNNSFDFPCNTNFFSYDNETNPDKPFQKSPIN